MKTLHFPLASAPVAIILNGARDEALMSRLNDYQHIVITDGAWQDVSPLLRGVANTQITVLGDGDSISHAPERFVQLLDQADTDFAKALRYLVTQQQTQADVFWAGGGEMDHFLGNLAVANQYAEAIQLHFFSALQSYCLLSESHHREMTLHGVHGRTLSLFPFPQARVSATGLAYPLTQLELNQYDQQSLRNHATADRVTLSVQGKLWLFVSAEKAFSKA